MRTDHITNTLHALQGAGVRRPRLRRLRVEPGDPGLLAALDALPAAAASVPTATGSSIAAHADHVRYGLSLMNRWAAGENLFGDADWSVSWKTRRSARTNRGR